MQLRSCARGQRLAGVRPRLVDELLNLKGFDGRDRQRAYDRADAQADVRLVGLALRRADTRFFVAAVPLPRPLLDGRAARRAAAVGQRFDCADFGIKTRLAVVLDILPDRPAVRAVADDDAGLVFVVGHDGNLS